MFGYIIANKEDLTPQQLDRYKSCYCGLCRSLRQRHGSLGRLTLTYDMTFLILVLSSLYEPEESAGTERCVVHPVHPHNYTQNMFSDYAADMNIALAYHNFLDDWTDDKNVISLTEAKLFKKKYATLTQRYPRQCEAVSDCLKELSSIEAESRPDPDAGANCFGRLMGELFVYEQDLWADRLRQAGMALGKFIYVMDACVDWPRDLKHGRYNPLRFIGNGTASSEEQKELLTILIADCAFAFDRLPLINDLEIINNILYSGVWFRYEFERRKRNKHNG
jgi:hypothetical protein